MISVGVLGATGRMGRLVVDAVVRATDLRLTAATTKATSSLIGTDAGALAGAGPVGVNISAVEPGCFADCAVVIDFSTPDALSQAMPALAGTALVTGTTGLSPELIDLLMRHSQTAPVLVAANFSTGVAVLQDLVRRASKALPDYDIEIVEAHHRFKRDAPSGTAITLGRAAAEARGTTLDECAVHGRHGQSGPRPTGEIGLHAVRGGGVVGEHEVWLCGPGERIKLSHSAIDRSTFADGAVRAARWLQARPAGRYTLANALGLTAT